MPRFCGSCGSPLREGAQFCPSCGTRSAASGPPQDKPPVRKSAGSAFKKMLLVLIGLFLAGYGLSTQAVALFGENKSATVTGVESRARQAKDLQGKSTGRTERYYSVKYGFTASDGSSQSGSYEVAQTATPPRVGATVYVRYLPMYPSLHAKGDEVGIALGGLGMFGLGLLILFFGSTR